MAGIAAIQPGGIGVVADGSAVNGAGNALPGVAIDLSFVGSTTSWTWTLTTRPAASTNASLYVGPPSSLFATSTPGLLTDVPGYYVVTFVSSASITYTLTIAVGSAAAVTSTSAQNESNALFATSYGVKADCRKITDGVLTAGSNILRSATAAFTQADVGKTVLLRTPTSPLPAGTVTLTSGNSNIAGASTAFLTDIPSVGSNHVPYNGGCVYVDGEYFAIVVVTNDTTLQVKTAPTHSGGTKILYRETQLSTTISSVIDATHAVLSAAGSTILVSGTSVWATISTDDTIACIAADAASWGGATMIWPEGRIGISANRFDSGKTGFRAVGQGKSKTIFTDLRKASDEYTYPQATGVSAFFALYQCHNIYIEGMSYDGNVPVLGMPHTTGGTSNASGGRSGWLFRECNNVTIKACGYSGFGARDEHWYTDAGSDVTSAVNNQFLDCGPAEAGAITNNNSINPGGAGKGCVITGNILNSAYTCISWAGYGAIITDNDLSQVTGFTLGNGADPLYIDPFAGGFALVANNLIHDCDNHGFSNGLIDIDGPSSDASSVVNLIDNLIIASPGWFYSLGSAIIRCTRGMAGTLNIRGNVIDKNTAAQTGGTFIYADGATTGKIYIQDNILRGRAGSNMTIGVLVSSTVPTGAIVDGGGNIFGESVTTTWSLNAAAQLVVRLQMPGGPIDVVWATFAGSPENNVVGSPGAFCADTTNGEHYVKVTGTSTNTGWKLITHA